MAGATGASILGLAIASKIASSTGASGSATSELALLRSFLNNDFFFAISKLYSVND
jgi:hypothetical protein